jgi:hypothetical protein
MSDKHNIKDKRLREFFRYHRNELAGKERNSFEKELQKDPFTGEAMEGFELLSPLESSNDISELHKRLKSRVHRKNKIVIYSIAASVAVLIAVSSILIITENARTRKSIAVNSISREPVEIVRNQPITEPAENITDEKGEPAKKEESSRPVTENTKSVTSQSDTAGEKRAFTGSIQGAAKNEKIAELATKPPVVPVARERISEPSAAMMRKKAVSNYRVEGKIISSEDNMPIPGVNVILKGSRRGVVTDPEGRFEIDMPDSAGRTFVAQFIGMNSKEFKAKPDSQVQIKLDPDMSALSEVVVVGYGRKDDKEEDIDYIPPQPVSGNAGFNKYIRENIRRPENMSAKKAVVVISFLVKIDGSIDSIRIVRSPGKPFSDEAIRLIRSGPAWKPAKEYGTDKADDVRVRIVFR